MQARIHELNLALHVRFHGVLDGDAKWRMFAETDALCLPTHYESETFPTVLLEAMSMSLPVVATRWRGIPEMAGDTQNLAAKPTNCLKALLELKNSWKIKIF